MKHSLVILLSCAVLAAVSCGKGGSPVEKYHDPDAPEWLYDESQPVPIEFGVGSVTASVAKVDFSVEYEGLFGTDWFRYGVLALDQHGDPHASLNGVEARNTRTNLFIDGVSGMYKAEPLDRNDQPVEHYYPMIQEPLNYTFYAYHTHNGSHKGTGDAYEDLNGTAVDDIDIGYCDILWAKSKATTLGSGVSAIEGYNARYIRALADANNVYLSSASAPRFDFYHRTARLVFFIQAEDAYSEETMTTNLVTIKDFTLTGLCRKASMDVTTGVLTAPANPAYETLAVNRDDTTPFQPKYPGSVWGDPVFVLPSSVLNSVDPTDGVGLKMTVNYVTGGQTKESVYETTLTGPFEMGKSYRFVITIKSYEQIEITSSVQPWGEDNTLDDFFTLE